MQYTQHVLQLNHGGIIINQLGFVVVRLVRLAGGGGGTKEQLGD